MPMLFVLKKWLMPAAVLFSVLALAEPCFAQAFNGRIDVTVADSTGAMLPGATVDLTGPVNISKATDPQGAAHFLDLTPGTYHVKVTLSGFSDYVNDTVPVAAGGSVPLRVGLSLGNVSTQVSVTAETPVIDPKKTGTNTTITLDELQNVPSGRDPWVVMQTVPGIIMDRVNVGGSESGQQSGYQAKGARGADATWNLDGVPITDMAATGATPQYWDFDMFQEMNVSTGGADLTAATGGVQLALVLKSGTNTPHGSARVYFEDESMQGNNMDPALATAIGSPNGKGNRTNQYADYGFEVGGPILKDRLWGWGSIGKTDVRVLTIKQTPDRTILKNYGAKVTGQVSPAIRGNFTYYMGDKNKFGRGASATHPPETTFDQAGIGNGFFKGEGNFVVGSNLFLTARVSHFGTGFGFEPEGGMNTQPVVDDSGVWHNTTSQYTSWRPANTISADGSFFKGRHELKFGYSWRKTEVHSLTVWPGNKTITFDNGYPNMIVEADADHPSDASARYVNAFIGDTITAGRLTANVGIRYDHQSDSAQAMKSTGVTFGEYGKYLPDLTAPAVDNAMVFNVVQPRASVTYALDEAHKTLLRGSYAMFASQLGNGQSTFLSVIQYRYIAFDAVDLNGNHAADPNEIDYNSLEYWVGFDLSNPSRIDKSVNTIGDYSVPKTHELIFGVDHELMKNFGVSGSFTYRKMVDFNWDPRTGVRANNYQQVGTFTGSGLPDGSSFSVPYYGAIESQLSEDALNGGHERVTHEGYSQRFIGFELSATKRLSNRWMARFAFSSNKHQEFYNGQESLQDPTPAPNDPKVDGGLVVVQSGGSGKSNIYQLLPLYQFIATGMYQAKWGIDLGFNYNMRQGFGQPWFRSQVRPGDVFNSTKTILVTDVGDHRLPTEATLDIRVGKGFRFNRANLNLDLDVFNLLNSDTVLGRQYDMRLTGPTGFNQVLEIINPRIARIGLRFNF
jgi:hypothetical protein